MDRLITLTGHKNTKKDWVARKLAENSDIEWIKPFTDKKKDIGKDAEECGGYHFISKEKMDEKLKTDEVVSKVTINDNRYVYFKSQLTADYIIMIVDDYGLLGVFDTVHRNKLYTVKLKSKDQIESDRVDSYLFDHEFDIIFDVDNGDIDELEANICYG